LSSEILYRATELLRASTTGREIFGTILPYNETVEIREFGTVYRERFQAGSFSRSLRERGDKIRLFTQHDSTRKLPVGKAVELTEHPDSLRAAFAIAATRDGDDILELVRSGTVDSFSVGFKPLKQRMDGNVLVRTECALIEVSLVGIPAYEGATVAGIRQAQHNPLSVRLE